MLHGLVVMSRRNRLTSDQLTEPWPCLWLEIPTPLHQSVPADTLQHMHAVYLAASGWSHMSWGQRGGLDSLLPLVM